MAGNYGCQSMVLPLKRVLVKRPDEEFAVVNPEKWNYTGRPDMAAAQLEHDLFVEILKKSGAEVIYHEELQPGRADSIYVHDPVIVIDQGAIILRMGKELRRGEEDSIRRRLEELGIPVHFQLHGTAIAEGGDLCWLDKKTLAAGVGFRTNPEGVRQLKEALGNTGVEVVTVELPYFKGPGACLHLMSFISVVDHDLAVIYPKYMSVPFYQYLKDRGFRLVEVPDEEFATMGPNVLALAPGDCVMLEGNPITKQRLEEAGCKVQTYRGNEISLKAEGGATCLTRPLWRSD